MILPKSNRLTPEQAAELAAIAGEFGCRVQPIVGEVRTIYAIVGDERHELMINRLEGLPFVDRVDTITFSARGVAEQFILDLAAHGLACTCLELQVSTENGDEAVRRWRHAGVLSAVDVVDRIRWQLEGWLQLHHIDGTDRVPLHRLSLCAPPLCTD